MLCNVMGSWYVYDVTKATLAVLRTEQLPEEMFTIFTSLQIELFSSFPILEHSFSFLTRLKRKSHTPFVTKA